MRSMLVIGGSEIISRLLVSIFEKRGWRVRVCGQCDAAMTQLAAHRMFDAVILNYRSPQKSVIQMIRLIRSFDHLRRIALVVVAQSDEIDRKAVTDAGADELVLRPFNPNSLTWAIDKIVAYRRSKAALS